MTEGMNFVFRVLFILFRLCLVSVSLLEDFFLPLLLCFPCSPCFSWVSLLRRCSSRTFRYGYLVTTSPQSSALPSAFPSTWVGITTSGKTNFHGVTGGVYKTRKRIHSSNADLELLAIPPSRRRVAACDLN
jgi:hypothetical protein